MQEAIDRIRRMEECFDVLQEAVNTNSIEIVKTPWFTELLQILVQYYESEQWLHDYELDEKGFLPQELKRGVLAQDAVYDFLERIKSIVG